PEQLAVVGYGEYAKPKYDLGIQDDVTIPITIRHLDAQIAPSATNSIEITVRVPPRADLRIMFRQSVGGKPLRSSAGAPPNGTPLNKLLKIEATQNQRSCPVICHYDKALWSGLSWAVGEIRDNDLDPTVPVTIHCTSLANQQVELKAE